MSSIKENMGADLSGYVPAAPAPPIMSSMVDDTRLRANVFMRCPLPPFNSDPDTLRQFETESHIPQIRVIPLPVMATVGTTITTKASTSATSSTASTTSTKSTLKQLTAVLTTPFLMPGDNFQGSMQLAKSFQLLSLNADNACEIRLYGTQAVQSFDSIRAADSPVAAEISSNIISCVSFDTVPYQWPWQNKIAANQDAIQTSTLYVTVLNTSLTDAVNVNVTVSYVPLES